MMLFINCLFWLKYWHFSAIGCKGFIISLRQQETDCIYTVNQDIQETEFIFYKVTES